VIALAEQGLKPGGMQVSYSVRAGVAQLVEHDVANVVVVGSNPITRFDNPVLTAGYRRKDSQALAAVGKAGQSRKQSPVGADVGHRNPRLAVFV
jgi:hypothetical protein